MREMRLVCPIFSAQIAFSGNQASIDFPSFPCPHAPFPLFPLYSPEKKKESGGGGEFEALTLLPHFLWEKFQFKKKRREWVEAAREQSALPPWGLDSCPDLGPWWAGTEFGGPFQVQDTSCRQDGRGGLWRTEDIGLELSRKERDLGDGEATNRKGWELGGGYGRDFHTFRGNSQWFTKDDTGGEGKKSD